MGQPNELKIHVIQSHLHIYTEIKGYSDSSNCLSVHNFVQLCLNQTQLHLDIKHASLSESPKKLTFLKLHNLVYLKNYEPTVTNCD